MSVGADTSDFFFFTREKLYALADEYHDRFLNAEPYEHVAIDNFLPDDVAKRLAGAFPGLDDISWRLEGPGDSAHSGDRKIEKVTTSDEEQFPPLVRLMMMQFQSGIFCNFLDRLSGHKHLLPDPNHYGCGLHSTGSGGRLMLHIDASRHPNKKLSQQINCIYYCTPDWQEEWGGNLELWDEDATKCVSSITPKFNRLAIFRVSGKSWHGQPFPLQTPPNVRRNSLALYYYSAEQDTDGLGYSNFVRWKAVSEHDKRTPLHRVKGLIRDYAPTPVINGLAKFARKTGLNFKR